MDGDGGGDDAPNGEAEVKEGGNNDEGVECNQRGSILKRVSGQDVFGIHCGP